MITIVCLVSANMPIFNLGQVQSVWKEAQVWYLQSTNTSAEFLQNIIYSRCKTNMYFEVCVNTKEINSVFFEMLLPA